MEEIYHNYRNELAKEQHTRDIFAIELIKTGIFFLDIAQRKAKSGYYPYDATRSLIIYTYEDFGDSILPINREYKPLGLSGYGERVDYKKYDFLLIPKSKVDFECLEGKYFFDDGSYPNEKKSKDRYIKMVRKFFKSNLDFGYIRGTSF